MLTIPTVPTRPGQAAGPIATPAALPAPAAPPGRPLRPAAAAACGIEAAGYFECQASLAALTPAAPFCRTGRRTPVRVRFAPCRATAADTVRTAHRFVVRFATDAGDWTLPACSLPLPLDGSVCGPDGRIDLHRWLWLASDRALPRSFRMMQGFGSRTLRLVQGREAVFARFHWLPAAGTHALAADEAAQLAETDPRFLRRDLHEAIEAGAHPRWQLALQVFSARQAAELGADPWRCDRLLPEDRVPLREVGQLVLDRVAEGGGDGPRAASTLPGIEPIEGAPAAAAGDDLAAARVFWHSLSRAEQNHLVAACAAEFAHLPAGLAREAGERLAEVDHRLAWVPGGRARPAAMAPAAAADRGVDGWSTLSLLAQPGERSIRMRRVALLLADGFEPRSLARVQRALRRAGAQVRCVGAQAGEVRAAGGAAAAAVAGIAAWPSVLWDAVVLPGGAAAQAALARAPAARRFVAAQYRHGKPILLLGADHGLLARIGIPPALPDGRPDPALVRPDAYVGGGAAQRRQVAAFIEALALPRRFDREPGQDAPIEG